MTHLRDLRILAEAVVVVIVTHVLLGWALGTAITQADGSVLVVPLVDSSLAAGPAWQDHLYRFAVLGGSKLHEFSGTPPLLPIAELLGLSTTTTVNVMTWFVQVAFAFFSILAIESLVAQWSAAPARLSAPRRLIAVWLCAFAPVLGWRIGIGHENLLFGLLPFLATCSLLLVARVRTPSVTALAFAAFAVANGVSGLGAQAVLYSVIFGLPIALAIVRPTREALVVAGTALGAVLLVLPRIVPMLAHAAGDDASRSLGDSAASSFGGVGVTDWLGSIPWTADLANDVAPHERNYPLGPLVLFAIAWARSRGIARAALGALVLAVLYAATKVPLPVLDAFREPARVVLVVLPFVPILALAAVWSRVPEEADPRIAWGSIVLAVALIVGARHVPGIAREVVAWTACGAVIARPQLRVVPILLAVVTALGVTAFHERLPRGAIRGDIADAAEVRDALVAQTHALDNPLDRVQLVDPPPPFEMSLGWAAGLSTLDGVWYPPRRFLDLLGALRGRPAPPTMCVFSLTSSRAFPALQQLYNVKYVVGMKTGEIQPLPATPGRAWFPTRLERAASPEAVAQAIWLGRDHLRETIATTGWLLARDDVPALDPALPGCDKARVLAAEPDARGQSATFRVQTEATCVLVVATNYVSTLRASHGGAVFPVDVALTGVVVPAGTTTFELAPVVEVALWTRLLQALGAALLTAAVVLAVRASRRRDTPRSEAAPP